MARERKNQKDRIRIVEEDSVSKELDCRPVDCGSGEHRNCCRRTDERMDVCVAVQNGVCKAAAGERQVCRFICKTKLHLPKQYWEAG